MGLRFIWHKLLEYRREVRTCLKVGAGVGDRSRFAVATLRYHALKALGRVRLGREVEYRIRALLPAKRIRVRIDSGDLMIFHEVFTSEVYSMPKGLLGEVRSVIDLGANIGMATLYFSAQFPAARFACVEPLPSNYSLLRFNLQGIADRTLMFQAAISNVSGQFDFEDTGNTYGCHLASVDNRNYRTRQTIKVDCIKLSEVLEKAAMKTVDLLKIDIEGAEESLLAGSPDWLKRVKAILIEIHAGYTIERLKADLDPQGFVLSPLGNSRPPKLIIALRQGDLRPTRRHEGNLEALAEMKP